MAITRAQQVRQMLRRGSNPNKQEGASEERTRDPRGGGKGRQDPMGGRTDFTAEQIRQADPLQFGGGKKGKDLFSRGDGGGKGLGSMVQNLIKQRAKQGYTLGSLIPGQTKRSQTMQRAYRDYLQRMGITPPDTLTGEEDDLAEFFVENAFDKPVAEDAMLETPQSYGEFIAENFGAPGVMMSGNVGGLETVVTERDELTGKPIKYGFRNVGGGEGGGGQLIIPQTMMASAPTVDDYYGPGGNPFLNRTAYRLLAEGGFLDDEDYVGGGIMDASGRQQYFLGKLVKSAKKAVKGVTRAVKKVAKSPLGKIAILGGLGAYAGGFGPFSSGKFGAGFLNPGNKTLMNILFKKGTIGSGLTGGGMLALAGGLTAAPFLFGQGDEEEETQTLDRGPGLNIAERRGDPFRFLAPRFTGSRFQFAADGGRIGLSNGTEAGADVSKEIKKIYKNFKKMKSKGVDDDILKMNTDYEKNFDVLNKLYNQGFAEGSKEPVAKKTMPLLDMGGKEMDLREEGGFVPIGRMEKADDVPARLSKNEFVFTADAVRNAGDGNVDKGAEVMYNMMKNLESGGDVSEESQHHKD